MYSYVSGPRGIDPATVQDITARCQVVQADAKAVRVALPAAGGAGPAAGPPLPRTACVLAAFTLFTPDAFSPHLIPFERAILQQYADCGLAGACKDEWGFPGRFGPRVDDVYFSAFGPATQLAAGRDLVRDLLLMVKPHRAWRLSGRRYQPHGDELAARAGSGTAAARSKVLGPQAMSATHPTWYAFACLEVFKNATGGPAAATWPQTDGHLRSALAPRHARNGNPLWVNMYYDSKTLLPRGPVAPRLGGGRINSTRSTAADRPRFGHHAAGRPAAGVGPLRLLNFIRLVRWLSVAVIFRHPAAVNFTGHLDVGLELITACGRRAITPTSSPPAVASGALTLSDGCIRYGPQRYAAAVLYQPQYERAAVAEFFRKAAREPAADKTALYRVGDWTMDFDGQAFDAASALPASMKPTDIAACAKAIIESLRAAGVEPQTLARCAGRASAVDDAAAVRPVPIDRRDRNPRQRGEGCLRRPDRKDDPGAQGGRR